MEKKILILSLVFVWIVPAIASAANVDVAVSIWNSTPDGDISYETSFPPTKLDLEDDFSYESGYQLNGRVKVEQLPLPLPFVPNFYAMATVLDFEEVNSRDDDFDFGNFEYLGKKRYTAKMRLNHYDFAFYWGVPMVKKATINLVNVDLGLNVRVYDFNLSLEQDLVNQNTDALRQSQSFMLPLPMVYAAAQFGPLSIFKIEAEARATRFQNNLIYSMISRLKGELLETAYLAIGYRFDHVEIDNKGVEADMNFSGLFYEAGIVFW